MSDLLAARTQMAISLGFHIVFAEIGIAMPLLMVLAEWRWRRTGDDVYLQLAKRWAKGSAILFAVGAVSGPSPRSPVPSTVEMIPLVRLTRRIA